MEAFPVVSTLPQQKGVGFFTVGLYDRFVYSIPTLGGVNTVTASAVEFNVTCQMIPGGPQQSGDVNITTTTSGIDIIYSFHVDDELADLQLFLGEQHCLNLTVYTMSFTLLSSRHPEYRFRQIP